MLIAVSGIIGAGKSTLTQNLSGVKFFEPVESNPYLAHYYQEPERWCFPMQMHLLIERWKMVQAAFWAAKSGQDAILDRSIYEDWAFASLGFKAGYMSGAEYKTYCNTHELVTSYHIPFPDLILHLDLEPVKALEHIKTRDRDCESGMMLDYLERLDAEYRRLLKALDKKTKVVYIDASQTPEEVLFCAQKAIHERRQELEGTPAPGYRGGC